MHPSSWRIALTTDPTEATAVRLRAAGCVFAEDEAALLVSTSSGPAELERMLSDRVAGLPLEAIVGWAEFYGLRIVVEPGVFVPRQRTEFLVRLATDLVGPGSVVLDLCCGTGAVGTALLAVVPGLEMYAADIDPAAVHNARRNLDPERVFEGDLYDALPRSLLGRVDAIVANAPYVPTEAIAMMPPEARLHEPAVALDGGKDGLDVQHRVAAGAPDWLAPGGRLLIETSVSQAPKTMALMTAAGLIAHVDSDDELSGTVATGVVGR